MNQGNNRAAGFTLLEILIVVALIGILAFLTIPQLIEFNKRQTLTSVTQDLAEAFKTAQVYASKGLQSDPGKFVKHYQVQLKHVNGDASGLYRGYEIYRLDDNGAPIEPAVDENLYSCPVCITSSSTDLFTYRVPSGQLDNITGNSETLRVCHPQKGYYDVEIDSIGKVTIGEFVDTSCTCSLDSCTP